MPECAWRLCNESLTGKQRRFCSVNCKNKFYVSRRRRKIKEMAVEYLGGKCQRCGYNKSLAAMQFHHLHGKDFGIAARGASRAWERVKKELEKCELLEDQEYRLDELERRQEALQRAREDVEEGPITYRPYVPKKTGKPKFTKEFIQEMMDKEAIK